MCFLINDIWCTDCVIVNKTCNANLECLLVKCRPFYLPREFSVMYLCAVYIHPKANYAAALGELGDILRKSENSHANAVVIVAGDFNKCSFKSVFPNYYQHVKHPTRGENILDQCFSNIKSAYRSSLRPAFGKSDHSSVLLLSTYIPRYRQSKPISQAVQCWTRDNELTLQGCFDSTDWSVFQSDDLNEFCDAVTGYIEFCIDCCVPNKLIKRHAGQSPWFNDDVKLKIKQRAEAFKSGDAAAYKQSRYALERSIRAAKRGYGTKIEGHFMDGDPRHMWNGLNSITPWKPKSGSITNVDPSLPNELNDFFCRFETEVTEPVAFIEDDDMHSGFTIVQADVQRVLSRTKVRKAPGPDKIPPRVLKLCSQQLAPVLTDLFNMSLRQSTVPHSFKKSVIIPVPKKTPVTCLNDYRPVALTSVLMKTFERLVLDFIKNRISTSIDPLQFAYRQNRSVEDAISYALSFVYKHLDKAKSYARMLFIDYSSAFNSMVPTKLILKLRTLGLDEAICKWILDFLTCRPQRVKINGCLSDELCVSTGSPQGCILSPLLFTLYTYDCVAAHEDNRIIKYADDTTVIGLISSNDESHYREEVENIVLWSEENNLLLNTSKTCELVIDFGQAKNHLPLSMNNTEVQIVDKCKFLGVTLSNDLKWKSNTSVIAKKARQRLFFLRKLRDFTHNTKILLNFYHCVIESVLTNCITVWFGGLTLEEKKTLNKMVRSASRTIGCPLPVLEATFNARLLTRALQIVNDSSHPAKSMFEMLPSGKRYRTFKCSPRHSNSFFPLAVKTLNHTLKR